MKKNQQHNNSNPERMLVFYSNKKHQSALLAKTRSSKPQAQTQCRGLTIHLV
jgi:hypothetical protein